MSKGIRRGACALLLGALAISFSGCEGYVEVEDRMIVAGAAIDYEPETRRYRVTAELTDLKAGSGQEADFEPAYLEGSGTTVYEAVDEMQTVVGNALYWGHAEVFLLGREAAAHGILPVLDWFVRDVNARLSSIVVMAETAQAADLFQFSSPVNKSVCQSLGRICREYENVSNRAAINVSQLINRTGLTGEAVVMPVVGTDETGDYLALTGAAVMADDRLSGVYDAEQTRYLMMLFSGSDRAMVTFEVPEYRARVAAEVLHTRTNSTAELRDGMPFAAVRISVDLAVVSIEGADPAILSDEGTRAVARAAEAELERQCCAVIEMDVTGFGADILGAGQILKHSQPRLWKQTADRWESLYPLLTWDLRVHAEVERSGEAFELITEGEDTEK